MSVSNKIDKDIVQTLLENYNEINQLRIERQKSASGYYQDFREKINKNQSDVSSFFQI